MIDSIFTTFQKYIFKIENRLIFHSAYFTDDSETWVISGPNRPIDFGKGIPTVNCPQDETAVVRSAAHDDITNLHGSLADQG